MTVGKVLISVPQSIIPKRTLNNSLKTSSQKEQIENNVLISSTRKLEQIKSFNFHSSQRE